MGLLRGSAIGYYPIPLIANPANGGIYPYIVIQNYYYNCVVHAKYGGMNTKIYGIYY